jgi:hypothetical protein
LFGNRRDDNYQAAWQAYQPPREAVNQQSRDAAIRAVKRGKPQSFTPFFPRTGLKSDPFLQELLLDLTTPSKTTSSRF